MSIPKRFSSYRFRATQRACRGGLGIFPIPLKCFNMQLRYSHAASTRAYVHPAACSSLDGVDQTLSPTLHCIRNAMFSPKHSFMCCASPQINLARCKLCFYFWPCLVALARWVQCRCRVRMRRGHSASCIHHNVLAVLRENTKLPMYSKPARKASLKNFPQHFVALATLLNRIKKNNNTTLLRKMKK